MPLSRKEKLLLGAAFMIVAGAGYIDGVYADTPDVHQQGGITEAARGVAESLQNMKDSITISTLHMSDSPAIKGDVIEATSLGGGSVQFNFAKNQICSINPSKEGKASQTCWPMTGMTAHNQERLKDVACSKAGDVSATSFIAKYCN